MTIPIPEKFMLTVKEAAAYFHIGEAKLRRIIDNDKTAGYLLWNGSRPQIKRRAFESWLNSQNLI